MLLLVQLCRRTSRMSAVFVQEVTEDDIFLKPRNVTSQKCSAVKRLYGNDALRVTRASKLVPICLL